MSRLRERTLLIAAVVLRILTCAVLGPTGSDHHYEVIEHPNVDQPERLLQGARQHFVCVTRFRDARRMIVRVMCP